MDRKKLIKHLVFLMFFIFIADIIAQKLHWYFSIWWFDMVMHFLGGFWVGLFFIWFFSIKDLPIFQLSLEKADFKLIMKTILFVLSFGILWEFFEIFTHNYIAHDPFNILDTTSDIFFDLAGGVSAILYYLKNIIPVGENKVQ
ncbi:MAG: hypothetical protein UU10_C0029G0006 [Parcubacteria group bacterium GW2011_GWF1_40_6]|uniref:Uncharacterized protein n=2 Tax=Candidatus Nomuraibacteriota TaxID=1752729 RepID=A0A0G0TUW1_9BACT|nr:MAG: hypothetical protein UT78_C0022G0020 [Candidatus Nomurabacteria bacterium GW2011_GWF2_40_12]KKR68221.1 MAG: hypothetical protein UU10_C0029G0006 [Parcubacteria group bacterium GW2011_GWF1_40_6]OGJ09334.1 MAG: hypothetical protein A2356_00555 [Candidatus Nomurabacteria bacterium RIFOXYB1_FULL_39_16]OGJ14748.1 MAG: hypothetical protein A2585_00915 [Candidatus Nomurabacteria bacterium RIFOXYD1_FULL_39_12]